MNAIRIDITITPDLLSHVDRAAKDGGESRSGWLAKAARERLEREAKATIARDETMQEALRRLQAAGMTA